MSDRVRKVQILKHPNGKSPNWYLRFWVPKSGGGWKQVWKSTGTPVKREAEAKRREKERELEGGLAAADDPPWDRFTADYIAFQADRRRAGTVRAYRTAFDAYDRLMRPKTVSDVTVQALSTFVRKRLAEGRRPATVNNALRHLKSALRWAEWQGQVVKAPNFRGLMIREDRPRPRLLTDRDFAAMVSAVDDSRFRPKRRPAGWWRTLLHMGFYGGLRMGEMLTLRWDDLDLEGASGRLDGTPSLTLRAEETKGRTERTVPLAAGMPELLSEWRGRQKDRSGKVLPWDRESPRALYDDWKAIQQAAGFGGKPFKIHDLRRGCASALIASGVSTAAVKEWLGHKAIATTESYYVNAGPALAAAAGMRSVTTRPP